MSKVETPSKKVKELSPNETLLLVQIHSLQLKNISLELRLLRMEKHFDQILQHIQYPVNNLMFGPNALMSI